MVDSEYKGTQALGKGDENLDPVSLLEKLELQAAS
jgi:hypothetical protein